LHGEHKQLVLNLSHMQNSISYVTLYTLTAIEITIRYDTIEEINVDSKAEYTA